MILYSLTDLSLPNCELFDERTKHMERVKVSSSSQPDSGPGAHPGPHLLIDIDTLAVALKSDHEGISLGILPQRIRESLLTADEDVH